MTQTNLQITCQQTSTLVRTITPASPIEARSIEIPESLLEQLQHECGETPHRVERAIQEVAKFLGYSRGYDWWNDTIAYLDASYPAGVATASR
jgi:hypothetical protein